MCMLAWGLLVCDDRLGRIKRQNCLVIDPYIVYLLNAGLTSFASSHSSPILELTGSAGPMIELSRETIREIMAKQRKTSHSLRPGFHSDETGEVTMGSLVGRSPDAMGRDFSLTEFVSVIPTSRIREMDMTQSFQHLRVAVRGHASLLFNVQELKSCPDALSGGDV